MFGIPRYLILAALFAFIGFDGFWSFAAAIIINVFLVIREDNKEAMAKRAPVDTSSKEYLSRYMPKI